MQRHNHLRAMGECVQGCYPITNVHTFKERNVKKVICAPISYPVPCSFEKNLYSSCYRNESLPKL